MDTEGSSVFSVLEFSDETRIRIRKENEIADIELIAERFGIDDAARLVMTQTASNKIIEQIDALLIIIRGLTECGIEIDELLEHRFRRCVNVNERLVGQLDRESGFLRFAKIEHLCHMGALLFMLKEGGRIHPLACY